MCMLVAEIRMKVRMDVMGEGDEDLRQRLACAPHKRFCAARSYVVEIHFMSKLYSEEKDLCYSLRLFQV